MSHYYWSGPVTYSFPTASSSYDGGSHEAFNDFSAVSHSQSQAVRYILEGSSAYADGPIFRYNSFEAVIPVSISEGANSGGGVDNADIRLAQSSSANPTAYAYYPAPSLEARAGDIWFGTSYNYQEPVVGTYVWFTHIHELGHAMGLKHGHEAGSFGALPADRDGSEFSVMTYRSYVGAPADFYRVEDYGGPQTLMMYDIAGLQHLYGANFTTNAADTVYRWNASTGEMSVNGEGQGAPGGGVGGAANRVLLTVWDGGGSDTYDLSNYSGGVSIDLRPGQWSITSQTQRSDLDSTNPGQHYAAGNVYNAFLYEGDARSYIENAVGGDGQDTLVGNDIENFLLGGNGNDILKGGQQNDLIDGGAGVDTAIFDGSWCEYQITSFGNGETHVADLRPGSADGLDRLLNVEIFQFADRTVFPFELVEAEGQTRLVREGTHFFLHDSDGFGPSLKYYGDAYRSGQFGDWTPIGAEATADGYVVAWKVTGADEYTFWNADRTGNYSSQLTDVLSGADQNLRSLESNFHQDLNGDGTIGSGTTTPSFETIESSGVTQLVQAGDHFFLRDRDGSGPSLKYYGGDYRAGQFGGWQPIGAEVTADGYVVAWKVAGADEYTFWNADRNGNYSSQLTDVLSGADQNVRTLESSFDQDLNGDGTIGVGTITPSFETIEAMGATRLVQVGDSFFLHDSAGSGPSLKYYGGDYRAGQFGDWAPIGVEATAEGYVVAWKTTGTDQFTFWNADRSGNYNSQLTDVLPITDQRLQALEPDFRQDFNGDGNVGLNIAAAVESWKPTTAAELMQIDTLAANNPDSQFFF